MASFTTLEIVNLDISGGGAQLTPQKPGMNRVKGIEQITYYSL